MGSILENQLHIDSFTFTKSFSHLLIEPKWSIFTIYVLIGSQNTLKYEGLEPVEQIEVALKPRNIPNLHIQDFYFPYKTSTSSIS